MRIRFSTLSLSFLLLIGSSNINAQLSKQHATILWNNIKRVSYDSMSSVVPQIVAQGDTVHFLWYGNYSDTQPDSGAGIQYARSIDGGITISPQRTLVPYDGGTYRMYINASGKYIYLTYYALVQPSPSPYWMIAVIRSTDAGITWSSRRVIGDYIPYAVAAKDSHLYVYAGLIENNKHYNMMLSSHDYGVDWDTLRVDLPRGPWTAQLAITVNGLHLIRSISIAGYYEIFNNKSIDFGLTWTPSDTLSLDDGQNGSNPRIASNGSYLYTVWNDQKYGGNFSGTIVLRRSTDDGITWQPEQIISQLNSAVFSDIAVENNLVAVVWDNEGDSLGAIRFRFSEDSGKSFSSLENITPDDYQAGNPSISISDKKIHVLWWNQKDREVYYRRGVFTPTSVKEKTITPNDFHLFQNYPNPFNNNTMISYSIPTREIISLKIYNGLGRTIKTLYEGIQESGVYNINLSMNNFSSGIYFIALRTQNGFHAERKILFLK